MRALTALFFVAPLTAQAAQLCVERLEDEGSANIYPVTLMLDKREAATLLGGTTTCVAMKAPGNSVWVRWHAFDWNRPDHGLHGNRVLHSPYTFAVLPKGTQRIDLKVCSMREQGGAPSWHIRGDGFGDCS
jgi:hypothetical protein